MYVSAYLPGMQSVIRITITERFKIVVAQERKRMIGLLAKGPFRPSGSVSDSENYIDLYLCHSPQAAAAASLLAAKDQMGL